MSKGFGKGGIPGKEDMNLNQLIGPLSPIGIINFFKQYNPH